MMIIFVNELKCIFKDCQIHLALKVDETIKNKVTSLIYYVSAKTHEKMEILFL